MSYSTVKGSVSRSASGLLGLVQRLVDRVISPDARRMTYSAIAGFAKERPLLASFVFTHLLFSFTPLLIFTVFIASTVLFALGTALLFSLFWLGVALLVLVPALFVTSTVAFLVYAWGLSSYIFIRQVSGWIPGLDGKFSGGEERDNVNGDRAESPALDGPSYAEVADPENRGDGNREDADGHL